MKRRGVTLWEVLVSAVLLAAMTAACLQFLGVAAAGRRAMDDRQTASREAANLMEHLAARSWDELNPQSVRAVQLSGAARRSLPGGELKIELTSPPGRPRVKRIAVTIRWQDRTGNFTRPVRLVAWRYRQ